MPPVGADADEKCPVDHQTRQVWLEAAQAKRQHASSLVPSDPASSAPTADAFARQKRKEVEQHQLQWTQKQQQEIKQLLSQHTKFNLDTLRWEPTIQITVPSPPPRRSLSTDREISSIPRASPIDFSHYNSAERAALPSLNNQTDNPHLSETGNWIYPSQEMFFKAMARKNHSPHAADMATIVPIHNAVNERAWQSILEWEKGQGSEKCGGPKLVSFAGDSKALTPKARWNGWMGYQRPFDRHDWVVDRCGKRVEYVIDFYKGKEDGGRGLGFYLDVRPKVQSWEGVRIRVARAMGM